MSVRACIGVQTTIRDLKECPTISRTCAIPKRSSQKDTAPNDSNGLALKTVDMETKNRRRFRWPEILAKRKKGTAGKGEAFDQRQSQPEDRIARLLQVPGKAFKASKIANTQATLWYILIPYTRNPKVMNLHRRARDTLTRGAGSTNSTSLIRKSNRASKVKGYIKRQPPTHCILLIEGSCPRKPCFYRLPVPPA